LNDLEIYYTNAPGIKAGNTNRRKQHNTNDQEYALFQSLTVCVHLQTLHTLRAKEQRLIMVCQTPAQIHGKDHYSAISMQSKIFVSNELNLPVGIFYRLSYM
jgi:hypothetical protein